MRCALSEDRPLWGQASLRTGLSEDRPLWRQAFLRTGLWGQASWRQASLRTGLSENRPLWEQASLRTGLSEDSHWSNFVNNDVNLRTYIRGLHALWTTTSADGKSIEKMTATSYYSFSLYQLFTQLFASSCKSKSYIWKYITTLHIILRIQNALSECRLWPSTTIDQINFSRITPSTDTPRVK